MFYPLSAFIAYRYARSGKHNSFVSFINRFSVAGIALGLMSLIVVVSVMNGFEAQLKQRILSIVPHIVVSNDGNTVSEEVRLLKGVIDTMPFLEAEALTQSRKALRGVQIQGVIPADMSKNTLVANSMRFGRFDSLSPGDFNVVIGNALATQLNIRIGDKVRIMTAGASVYTPFGRMPSQRLFTITGLFDVGSQLDSSVVYMHLDDARRLLRKPQDFATSERLFLEDAFEYQTTVDLLRRQAAFENLEVNTWRERQGPLFDAVKMEKNMMFLMLLLVIAVAAFNIVSALVMVVSEKQGDIAVLQTQGMSGSVIMWIFVLNGLFNGIKGTGIGLILGVVLALSLNGILTALGVNLGLSADGAGLPVVMNPAQIASVTLLSLLLCVCASVYPARKAMKIKPATALQNE